MPSTDADVRPAATFQEHLEAGEFFFQSCQECSRAVFYPRVVCPFCGGTRLEWRPCAGRGVVYSTTAVPQRDQPSYAVCLVDLDEGFRMMSTVVDTPAEEIAIGARVVASVEGQAEESRVVFRLESEASDV